MQNDSLNLPRLPVLGWATFTGKRRSSIPCFLDLSDIEFTSSGHAAISLALKALNVGPGSRVLVPTYHCPTMIAPVVSCGAEPVFYPIDTRGAPNLRIVTADAQTCKAMLVAHYFGIPQPLAGIRAFCDAHDIALIEDCAHAFFGTEDGRTVGLMGDFAIASLTKFLPTNDGGSIRPSPSRLKGDLGERRWRHGIKAMANAIEDGGRYGRFAGVNGLLRNVFSLANVLRGKASDGTKSASPVDSSVASSGNWLGEYTEDSVMWKRATFWARWTARHVHRERIVENRRRNYNLLRDLLSDLPGTMVLCSALPAGCAPYVFPLWVDSPEFTYPLVRARGIPVFRWDQAWPSTPKIGEDVGMQWATHVFQLGCHQDLRPSDIERMAAALHFIFSEAAGNRRTRNTAAQIQQFSVSGH